MEMALAEVFWAAQNKLPLSGAWQIPAAQLGSRSGCR